MSLRDVAAKGRQAVRRSGPLYRAYAFANPRLRDRRVTRRTDLVMDGFPRSANTYSVAAFQQVNGTDVWLSTHLHNPFALIRGVRLRRPTVLLVRRPGDLVNSLLHFHATLKAENVAELQPAGVLEEWLRFHTVLMPHLDGMLVAEFSEVVGDFGVVLDRVNAHFGTSFVRYDKTEENEAAVRATLDAGARHFVPGEKAELVVGRPSDKRERAPHPAMAEPHVVALLEQANALYEQLLAKAPHRV